MNNLQVGVIVSNYNTIRNLITSLTWNLPGTLISIAPGNILNTTVTCHGMSNPNAMGNTNITLQGIHTASKDIRVQMLRQKR